MSKKDYQAIAGAIWLASRASERVLTADVIERIADVMARDNGRFDRARFIEACETGKCKGMRARVA